MKNRVACTILVFQLFSALPWLYAAPSGKDNSWEVLKHVTHRRTYTFVDRQGRCTEGEIVATSESAVTLKVWRATRGRRAEYGFLTLDRANVLRVLDGPKTVDVVYSGASSWSDVRALEKIGEDEGVLVVTREGKHHKGKFLRVGDQSVRITYWGQATEIRKTDISEVSYVREAPLSAGAEYAAQEAVFIDPELWPYVLHIPPKIRVLLYDASLPDENTRFSCPDLR